MMSDLGGSFSGLEFTPIIPRKPLLLTIRSLKPAPDHLVFGFRHSAKETFLLTEKHHEPDRKAVQPPARSFCQPLQGGGGEVVPAGRHLSDLDCGESARAIGEPLRYFSPLSPHLPQKPSEICKAIGLCKGCEKQEKLLQVFMNEAAQAAEVTENARKAPLRRLQCREHTVRGQRPRPI